MFEEDDWNMPPTVKSRIDLQAVRRTNQLAQIHSTPASPLNNVLRRNTVTDITTHSQFHSRHAIQSSASSGSVPDCSHMDSNEALHHRLAAAAASGGDQNFLGGNDDKLFNRLLDDLDNISSSSASAHRRKKAKEIFTSWLFSPGAQRSDPSTRRFTTDFTDYDFLSGSGILSEDPTTSTRLSRDMLTRHSIDERTKRVRDDAPRRLSSGNVTRPNGNVARPKSARSTSEVSLEHSHIF